MLIPLSFVSFKKLVQAISLLLLVFALWNGLLPSTGQAQGPAPTNQLIERIDKGEFYYSGGKIADPPSFGRKIPLVRHKNLFAVKFSSGRVTPPPHGLKLSEKSKFFERHKIHLLESCDEGNGKKHDDVICCLRDDPDVEYVQPVFVAGADEPMVMTDCFVAKFANTLSKNKIDEINAENGVEILKPIEVASNVYVLKVIGLKNRTTLDVANKYYEMKEVEWSHPDWIRAMELRSLPNDPLFPNQWHLNNDGTAGGIPDADIDAPEAWDLTKGSGEIVIAIIDDGVETSHEDFAGKVVPGRNVVDDNDNPNPQYGDNHGTAVAGLATANQDNGMGVSGVAPNCKLMPIRLIAYGMTVSDEAEAFLFAAQNGADIISNSWGPLDGTGNVDPLPDLTKAAIDYAADNGRGGKGCIIFFAAGNGNESVDNDGYASYDKVIAVGASTDQDVRSYYSDYGLSLDVMSPSSGGYNRITTTDRMESEGYDIGNYTNSFGGTSAAAPIAAGVAALMLSVNSELSRSDVQGILQYTADKINPSEANYDANGFSQKYGYGRVNAHKAVLEAINPNFPPVATIQSPSEDTIIHVGESVNFTGDAVDRENAIVSYHWDFDGGAPDASVEDPGLVTFNTAGTFRVTFTVADNGGKQSSDSVRILVIEQTEDIVSYMVNSTGTPIDIPENQPAGISSTVVAGRGKYIVEVNVSVNITHTYIGDLTVSIESPQGTEVKLHHRNGGSSDNLITTYDTLTMPAESLDAFAGEDPKGVWTLYVADNADFDVGTLNDWQLEIVAVEDSEFKRPDLVVTKMNIERTRKNRRFTVNTIIKNQGIIDSDAFEVTFLLSTDKELDANDINLKTVEVAGLESEEELPQETRLTIPTSVSRGKYYLIVDVDPTNLIRELEEANNYRFSQRPVNIK